MYSTNIFLTIKTLINLECRKGRFGQNCRQQCSKHCVIPETCDRVTGHCVGGCQAGWKHAQCDQSKILKICFPNFATFSIFKTSVIDQLNQRIIFYMQSVMVRCLVKIAKGYVGSALTMNSAIILMGAVWMDVTLAIMESPVLKVPISDHNNYTFFSTFFAYPLSLQLHYPKKENIIFIYSIPLYSSSDCYYYFFGLFSLRRNYH